MRLPHRSIQSIQAIPSIHTAFDSNYEEIQLNDSPQETAREDTGDGIEVVPLERQTTSCAKILSPCQEEKEVISSIEIDLERCSKPLPALPLSRWERVLVRKRVIALCGLLLIALLSIGLCFVFVRGSPLHSRSESKSPSTTPTDNATPIQRGTFAIPISTPEKQSSACLGRKNESSAWQCAANTVFQISILPSAPQQASLTMVSLRVPSNSTPSYGPQAPDTGPVELYLAKGQQSLSDGPVYGFRANFTHFTFLKEGEFGAQQYETGTEAEVEPTTVAKGDKLWQCAFDETAFEGFIYASLPSSSSDRNMQDSRNPLRLPYIPYVIRLLEYKSSHTTNTYCQKMEMLQNGTMEAHSEKVMLDLNESGSAGFGIIGRAAWRRQQTVPKSSCLCQWIAP